MADYVKPEVHYREVSLYELPGRTAGKAVSKVPLVVTEGLGDLVGRADATCLLEGVPGDPRWAIVLGHGDPNSRSYSGGELVLAGPVRAYLAVVDAIWERRGAIARERRPGWRLTRRIMVPVRIAGVMEASGALTDLLAADQVAWLAAVCAPLLILQAPDLPFGVEGRDSVMISARRG